MSRFIAALVALGLVAAACTTRTARSTTADRRFVPSATIRGGTATLGVTIPDGRRLRLRYPKALALAQLGVSLSVQVDWSVRPDPVRCCGKQLALARTRAADLFAGEPLQTYPGAAGQPVRLFHASQRRDANVGMALDYLVFQFGPWLVEVYDLQHPQPNDYESRMTDAERSTWARSLSGRVDRDGYLVVTARPPLHVEPQNGAEVVFGAPRAGAPQVELADSYCGQPQSDTTKHRHFHQTGEFGVAWCDPTGFHVSATGPEQFVTGVSDHLQLAELAPA